MTAAPTFSIAQEVADVTIVRPKLASVVYDRRGGLLGEIGPEARSWVRLVDLPAAVGQAFVATEDRRFYQHDGVDVIGLMGALRDNILQGFGSRGASTITQQLIGAMYPEQVDRRQITLGRKIREAEMARALERRHGKAEILEAYVNYIGFGHGWYGIEAAARHYFGKHASEVTLAETALLAAIPNSPGYYDPRAHPDRALRRRNLVLRRMQEERYLTPAAARAAMREPLRLAPDEGFSVRARYVVEWVRRWLTERYGLATVNTGGLAVTTTLDPDLQRAASSSLAAGLARVESLPGYRSPRYGTAAGRPTGGRTPYLQGLFVALDPSTGDVLALEGGRDFRDSEFDRALQGHRQAGSAFKPVVYAAALAEGLPPTTMLDNSPLSLPQGDGTRWTPENSDGTWTGPVTMRTALVRSLNLPTIRLALIVGLDSVVATARRLGLTTPIPPVASTAIGAADVRPIELVAAYGAFATLGAYIPPRIVTLVQGSAGLPVYEAPPVQPAAALDPRVAFQVVSVMEDAVTSGTGTAARRGLPAALPVAGKTGTTNDNADVWFIGLTPDIVAGVWLGFDRPRTITPGAFGGTLAAPVWGAFAAAAYAGRPIPPAWQPPRGLVALRVRRSDGRYTPQDTTGGSYTEYFLEGTEPTGRGAVQRALARLRFGLFGW
ncbi:MAG: PBP1A family penicillin-binding protein [Gemmatimonadota bacterium]